MLDGKTLFIAFVFATNGNLYVMVAREAVVSQGIYTNPELSTAQKPLTNTEKTLY